MLKENGFTVSKNEVIAVVVPDQPGGLSGVLTALEKKNINVEYMYAVIQKSEGNAVLFFRVDEAEGDVDTLRKAGVLSGSEVYDKAATDLTAEVTKLKSAGIEAIVNWSIELAQAIVIKNARQMGMKVPIFQSHGFGNIKYVKAAGAAAEGVLPAGRLLVAETSSDRTCRSGCCFL